MSYQLPKFRHPELPVNELGYTKADYEGAISTLCAGCGHDSISGAIVKSVHELSIEPHKIAKLSGIGCSSKAPTYFLGKELLGTGTGTFFGPTLDLLWDLLCISNEKLLFSYFGVSQNLLCTSNENLL